MNSVPARSRLRRFPWLDSEFGRARWTYVIGLCYLLIGYMGTNEIAALNPWDRPALPIATGFDKALPFTPWMVFFYVMYYPLLITPLILAADAVSLMRLTLAQTAMNTVAYVIFLLFPTPIDRPPAVPVEGVFHYVLDTLFRADHPYNTFPSLHVAQASILGLFYLKYAGHWSFGSARPPKPHQGIRDNRFAFGVLIFHAVSAFLVAASAVLIKQHYLADAMAGALLAWTMAFVFFRKPR